MGGERVEKEATSLSTEVNSIKTAQRQMLGELLTDINTKAVALACDGRKGGRIKASEILTLVLEVFSAKYAELDGPVLKDNGGSL